jgi:hypothetical protein
MNKLSKFFTILAMLVLLLAACGKPTPTAVPTATPTARPPIPDGVYTYSITKDELTNAGFSEPWVCENAGSYSYTVTGDRWKYDLIPVPGCKLMSKPFMSGSWKISSDSVTFTDDKSQGCSMQYTYKWTFDGASLRFTLVEDPCAVRVVLMTLHPWILQK